MPEMDQQRLARRQRGEQVLGAPGQRRHLVADQPVAEPGGEGNAQVGPADLDGRDARRRPSPAPASAAPVRLRAVRARHPRSVQARAAAGRLAPGRALRATIESQTKARRGNRRPAQPWSFRVRRLRKVSQARNRHDRGAAKGEGEDDEHGHVSAGSQRGGEGQHPRAAAAPGALSRPVGRGDGAAASPRRGRRSATGSSSSATTTSATR